MSSKRKLLMTEAPLDDAPKKETSKADEERPRTSMELARGAANRWQRKLTHSANANMSGHDMESLVHEIAWLVEQIVDGTIVVADEESGD